MSTRVPRLLLAGSAAILALGAIAHAAAFPTALAALDGASLPPFIARSCQALWLADSATLFLVAVVFAAVAWRPGAASGPAVMLVALIPAATAVLIYTFVGPFYAGHVLLAAGAAGFVAGLRLPGTRGTSHPHP